MNDKEYSPFSDKEYFAMWGVNTEEELHFYYDESNNCRKFWLDSSKNNFNHDFRADFVLAGIASENEFQIPFEELKQRFGLQKNAVELKSKSLFRGKDFLQCMGMKQVTALVSKRFKRNRIAKNELSWYNFHNSSFLLFLNPAGFR